MEDLELKQLKPQIVNFYDNICNMCFHDYVARFFYYISYTAEAVVWKCSLKERFLKVSHSLQEKAYDVALL